MVDTLDLKLVDTWVVLGIDLEKDERSTPFVITPLFFISSPGSSYFEKYDGNDYSIILTYRGDYDAIPRMLLVFLISFLTLQKGIRPYK